MANVNCINKNSTDYMYEDTAGRDLVATMQDNTLVAVQNYAVDDLFWYNNLLYRITTAVSSGATIVITGGSADAVQTTVSDELKRKADNTTSFTVASSRTNIASGETMPTILGKIAKWFTDLKDLAFIAKGSGSSKFLREDGTWQSIDAVNNGKLTITVNGTDTEFTANQSGNSSVAFMAPKWHQYNGSVEEVILTQATTSAVFHGLNANNAYDPYYQTADGTKLTNCDWSLDVVNNTMTVTFDAPTAAQVAGNAGKVMLLEITV